MKKMDDEDEKRAKVGVEGRPLLIHIGRSVSRVCVGRRRIVCETIEVGKKKIVAGKVHL